MTTVYLTGDRSMSPMAAVGVTNLIIMKLLNDHPEGIVIVTGDSPSGIEKAVRYLIPQAALKVFARELDEEGRPDFDGAHKALLSEVDEVVVIHTDPLNSRLTKSVAQTFPAEKVHYPIDEALNQAPNDPSVLFATEEEPVSEEEMPPDPFAEETKEN